MNIGDIRDFGVVLAAASPMSAPAGTTSMRRRVRRSQASSLHRWCHGANARHTTATISVCLRCEIAACWMRAEPWKVPGNKCNSTVTPTASNARA